MADALSLIPAAVQRNLSDKLYEKRKYAALEIENTVKNLTSAGDHDKLSKVIDILVKEFAKSPQPNHRKGGVLALAAVTVGLSSAAPQYLEQIVPPVIESFIDQDSRVRYYACEALYNIAKIVRGEFIFFFNQIFDALCKLSADSDPSVQSAAHVLDGLVKDIVTESDEFSAEEFIPLLKERMNVLNPYVRRFLVDWITLLDSVPDFDMLGFLPDFLDGLFNMLSDSSHEIRQHAVSALSEFLQEIKNSPSVDYGRMAEILVQRASSPDEFTRLTAITWINEFVKLGGDQLVRYYADILGAILPCISDKNEEIREVARETNEELRSIHVEPSDGFDVGAILSVAKRQLSSDHEATRIEALNWISTLLNKHRAEVMSFLYDIFDTLLKALSDSSDDVVLLVLEVHADIAKDPQHFRHLIVFLIHNFRSDSSLLERRGALIIRRLCVLLDAERVYRELSTILEGEDNLDFASTMVQALNLILLTSSELSKLRNLLRGSLVTREGKELLVALYASWCHSPVAIISLCLLSQAYQHASVVIQSLVEEDMNVKFFVQLDKLIRLLETPIFTYLRLQLLEPGRYPWLLKTLYGLLMLLPQQSGAFRILQTRLKTVPTYSFSGGGDQISRAFSGVPFSQYMMHHHEDGDAEDYNINSSHQGINFAARLQQFENVQNQHRGQARIKRTTLIAPPLLLHQRLVNCEKRCVSPFIFCAYVRTSKEQQPPSLTSLSIAEHNRPPARSSRKGSGQLQL
ncbi:BnaC07g21040D [Brassica napus]|uniref:BnaC07g21040D protein n=1 Tax=Brassica napus TaxID=3708 RepID=A0A078HCX4_BRANA|nr:BnaC07g21040D [Brassica napus]